MKKKKVAILGATGMLGSAIYKELKDSYELVLVVRDREKIGLLDRAHGGVAKHHVTVFDAVRFYEDFLNKKAYGSEYFSDFVRSLVDADYIVNTIGITIPYALETQHYTFFINSFLPHMLASAFGSRLIHVTTDCVYNGKEGFPYDEKAAISPVDIYGLSKGFGEPQAALTIRTSIIGRELEGFTGLVEWFLAQKGKKVTGFANHFWNGITTKQFAKVCDMIMSNPDLFPKAGVYHIFTNPVSKYDMLLALQKRFNVDCVITPEYENKLNRTLTTIHDFNGKLDIPSFDQMVQEM